MTSVNEERANVSFVQSCGRGLAPEVAVHFKARRCRLPPYSVDFVDGRNIPIEDSQPDPSEPSTKHGQDQTVMSAIRRATAVSGVERSA